MISHLNTTILEQLSFVHTPKSEFLKTTSKERKCRPNFYQE